MTITYLPTFSDSSIISTGYTGLSYLDQVSATANPLGGTIVYSANLSNGLFINSSTGIISGIPTTVGSAEIVFVATNNDGETVSPTRYIAFVDSLTLWNGPNLLNTAKTGLNYSANVSATYATSYSLSGGQLPSGISLNTATGVISGKTYDIDSFSFDITANVSPPGSSGTITRTYTMSSEKSNVSGGIVSTPSNLYAERVYAEQPLALWSMDENVDYISKISENQRDMEKNWEITNGVASEFSDININPPMASIVNAVTVPDYEENPDAVLEATNLVTNPSMETAGESNVLVRENLIKNPTMDGVIPDSSQIIATNLATNPDMVTTSETTAVIRENLLANPSFEKVANGTDIVRSNFINNPSFEISTGGWTNQGNSLLSRVADNSIVGSYVAKLEATAGGASGSDFFAVNAGLNQNLVDPEQTYTFSIWVKSTTAKIVGIRHAWIDAASDVIGNINTFSLTSLSANTWTRISTTQTAPANAYRLSVGVIGSVSETWAPGDILYLDGAMLEDNVIATTYFDGSVQNSLSDYYSWTEEEHNSPSVQTVKLVTTLTNIAPNPTMYSEDGRVEVRRNHAKNSLPSYIGGTSEAVQIVARTNLSTNPSFEFGTAGWEERNSGTSLEITPEKSYSGSSSLRVYQNFFGNELGAIGTVPCVANQRHSVSFKLWLVAGKSITVRSVISSGNYGPFITVNGTSDWQTVTVNNILPSGNETGVLFFSNTTSLTELFIDEFIVEKATEVGEYFDGNSLPESGITYEWEGATHDSLSFQLGEGVPVTKNLILNSSFEKSLTNWNTTASVQEFSQDSDVRPGRTFTSSAKIVTNGTASSGIFQENIIPYNLDSTHTLSAWVKGAAGKTLTFKASQFDSNLGDWIVSNSQVAPLSGSWQRISLEFSVTELLDASLKIEFLMADSGITTFYIDDILLQSGDKLNTYFDGDSANSSGLLYRWDGAIQESSTTVYGLPAKGFSNTGTSTLSYIVTEGSSSSFARYYADYDHDNVIDIGNVSNLDTSSVYLFKATVKSSRSRTINYSVGANENINVSLAAGQWKDIHILAIPSNVDTNAKATITSMIAGEIFDIKNVLVEKTDSVTQYFDGNFPSTDQDLSYSWLGEEYDSNSVLTGNKVYGLTSDDYSCAAIQSTKWAYGGTYSLRIINKNNSELGGVTVASVDQTTYGPLNVPQLLPGKTYTVKAIARLDGTTTSTDYSRSICFANGSTVLDYAQAPNTTGVHELSLTFTVPADSTSHRVFLTGSGLYNSTGNDIWWDNLLIVRGEYTGSYFDGSTENETDRYYSWAGEPRKSASYRQGLGLYAWTGVNAAPVYELDHARSGVSSASMRVTDNVEYPRMTSDNVLVTPGLDYTLSAYLRLIDFGIQPRMSIDWKDSAGVIISRSEAVYPGPSSRIWVNGTAPAGAVQASASIGFEDYTIASTRLVVDDVMFEQSQIVNSYFDGSSSTTPEFEDILPQWSAEQHASSSVIQEFEVKTLSSIIGKTSIYSVSSPEFSKGKAARVLLKSSDEIDIAVNAVDTIPGNTYTLLVRARSNSLSKTVYPQISGDIGDPVFLQQGVWTDIRMVGVAVTGAEKIVGLRLPENDGYYSNDTIDIDYSMVVDGEYYDDYFDGSISYGTISGSTSWTGEENNSTSVLTGPQLYFWSGYNTGVVSSATRFQDDQEKLCAAVLTNGLGGGITTEPMPTIIGEPYTFSAYVYVKKQETITIEIDEASKQLVVQPNVWTRIAHSRNASSTEHSARLLLTNNGGEMLVDEAMFERGSSVLDYFDGETISSDEDLNFSWSGIAHQSSSTIFGTTVADFNAGNDVALIQSSSWQSNGTKSMRMISLSRSNESGTGGAIYNISNLENGKEYTAMIKYRLLSPLAGDKNLEYLTLRAANSEGKTVVRTPNGLNSTGTHELKLTFTKTSEITALHLSSGVGSGSGDVWWDDFIVVRGNYNGPYFDGDSIDSEIIGENVFEWTGTPHESTSTKSVLQTSVLTTMTSPVLGSSQDFNTAMESIAFSTWLYPFERTLDAYIGYTYVDINGNDIEYTQKFDINEQETWSLLSYSFKLPQQFTELRMIVKTLVGLPTKSATTDSYKFLVHGISVGQWSEQFFTRSLGTVVQELPEDVFASGTGVAARAYGLQKNNGYYMSYDNRLSARNTGLPMVYGASNSTKITPAPTSGDPSFIFPGLGFMNSSGQYADLTLEMWIKIQSSATEPRRILGPVAEGSTDGLYVNDGFLVLKVGDYFDSYLVKEWDRPMLVAIKLNNSSAALSINGEEVINFVIDSSKVKFPENFILIEETLKNQDFIGIYGYSDVPSIDVDCVGIYPYIVPDLVEKRRFVYGQGVDVPEAILGSGSDSTVTIDYPVANYAKNYLYPDIGRWNQGVSENLTIENTSINTSNYVLPTIFFSNQSEKSWYSDIESVQVSGLEPFINLKPKIFYDEEVSVWENTEGYILFDSISTLSEDLEAFYGIFMPDYAQEIKQTLFFIEDEESGNYLEIFIDEENNVVYELATANSAIVGGYEKTIIYSYKSNKEAVISVGVNIDNFANTYGEKVLDFFGKISTLKFYVAGSRLLENTFNGNIFSVGFCTSRNLQKILNIFASNGTVMKLEDYTLAGNLYDGGTYKTDQLWEVTVNAGNVFFGSSDSGFISTVDGGSPFGILTSETQSHTASYTLLPKNYLGKFVLDIATNGYWQDHVPLGYFGKYVNAGDNTEYYELDFLQFNIAYPSIRKYLEGIYDTKDSVVKTFISFDYMQDDASIDIVGYATEGLEPRLTRLEPAPASNVISPGSNWPETLYEVTNETIIYPPSNVDFNDIALVLHVEVVSKGILENPIKIESLQIASTALNSFVPNPVGTKNGKEIFPYLRSSGYFDYKGKNPYSIYKGTSPYLYLTGTSGIKLLDFKDNSVDRGISIPINTERTTYYKLSAIQFSARYDNEYFPNRVVEVMEIESKEGTLKVYMVPEDGQGARARLYAVDAQTGLPYNNLVFFINGVAVTEAIVEINSWFMLAIVFNSALDFSEYSGAIRMTGPLLFNNLSYYKTRESDEENKSTYRKWFGVSTIDGDPVLWNYWKNGLPEVDVPSLEWEIQPFTWKTVLYATLLPSAAIDGEVLYKKFTGTNRFTVDTNSLLRIRNYQYSTYNAPGWQTKVTSPV
jgi:hypothetical protein